MVDETHSHAQPYHHGDLPRALLAAAHDLIEQSGLASLTLRAVAQRVGVTHAAPYRHFKDKAALIAAVAARSLDALVACVAAETDAVEAAVAYVRHATMHRESYAIIFASNHPPAVMESFAKLLPGDQREGHLPTAIWSLCHGLTACVIHGGATGTSIEHVARAATRSLIAR